MEAILKGLRRIGAFTEYSDTDLVKAVTDIEAYSQMWNGKNSVGLEASLKDLYAMQKADQDAFIKPIKVRFKKGMVPDSQYSDIENTYRIFGESISGTERYNELLSEIESNPQDESNFHSLYDEIYTQMMKNTLMPDKKTKVFKKTGNVISASKLALVNTVDNMMNIIDANFKENLKPKIKYSKYINVLPADKYGAMSFEVPVTDADYKPIEGYKSIFDDDGMLLPEYTNDRGELDYKKVELKNETTLGIHETILKELAGVESTQPYGKVILMGLYSHFDQMFKELQLETSQNYRKVTDAVSELKKYGVQELEASADDIDMAIMDYLDENTIPKGYESVAHNFHNIKTVLTEAKTRYDSSTGKHSGNELYLSQNRSDFAIGEAFDEGGEEEFWKNFYNALDLKATREMFIRKKVRETGKTREEISSTVEELPIDGLKDAEIGRLLKQYTNLDGFHTNNKDPFKDRVFVFKNHKVRLQFMKKYGGMLSSEDLINTTIKKTYIYLNYRKYLTARINSKIEDLAPIIRSYIIRNKRLKNYELNEFFGKLTTNIFESHILSNLDMLSGNIGAVNNTLHNKYLFLMKKFYTVSALSGLSVTTLANDSVGYAFLHSGIVDQFKKYVEYYRDIFKKLDPVDKKVIPIALEDYLGSNMISKQEFHNISQSLESITGVQFFTDSARVRGAKSMVYDLGWAVENDEQTKLFQFLKKGYGLTDADFKELAKYVDYDARGNPYISLHRLQYAGTRSASKIMWAISSRLNIAIPIHGLTSMSISQKAKTNYSMLNHLISSILLFKGLKFQESAELALPFFRAGFSSGQGFREGLKDGFKFYYQQGIVQQALYQSLLFNLMKHMFKGQIPDLSERKRALAFASSILLDTPLFLGVGGMISDGLSGKSIYNSFSNNTLGFVAPAVKVADLAFDALHGKIGKGLNSLISVGDSLNPLHNFPIAGLFIDRMLVDGLRDLVYPDVNRYYGAYKRYVHDQGYRYPNILAPNAVFGSDVEG